MAEIWEIEYLMLINKESKEQFKWDDETENKEIWEWERPRVLKNHQV